MRTGFLEDVVDLFFFLIGLPLPYKSLLVSESCVGIACDVCRGEVRVGVVGFVGIACVGRRGEVRAGVVVALLQDRDELTAVESKTAPVIVASICSAMVVVMTAIVFYHNSCIVSAEIIIYEIVPTISVSNLPVEHNSCCLINHPAVNGCDHYVRKNNFKT